MNDYYVFNVKTKQMKKTINISLLFFISIIINPQVILAQKDRDVEDFLEDMAAPINTTVPFLTISPDARSGGMGDIGAASSPDAFSQHWNPAKYAFIESEMGISLTYSPWMRSLVDDMNLLYLSGYKRLNDRSAFAGSLTYFSLGEIIFRENQNDPGTVYKPNEFAFDLSYSNQLTEHFSIAVAGRFIYSNLTQGQMVEGQQSSAGMAGAADVALYYQKDIDVSGLMNSNLAIGLDISNIGNKISYSDNLDKDFLPTNLRIGAAYKMQIDEYNAFTILADLNKLLVPSSPVRDSSGEVIAGIDDDVSPLTGMIHSFYDAPGGFKEEMHEIMWSIGAEYSYNNIVAFRAGYFHEHKTKGNRQYLTLGAGLKYNVMGLDFSYLIPVSTLATHPLKNTLRFSLTFDIGDFKKQQNKNN